jgi:hypothetical protein
LLISKQAVEAPVRTNIGNADLVLGFDVIGVANPEHLKYFSPERTTAVIQHESHADHRRDSWAQHSGWSREDDRADQRGDAARTQHHRGRESDR